MTSHPFAVHADPIKSALAHAVAEALAQLGLDTEGPNAEFDAEAIQRCLEKPPEFKMGDYALPCFRFAKALRKGPPVIAGALAASLAKHGNAWIARTEVVGAFLNIFIDQARAAKLLLPEVLQGSYFTAPAMRPGTPPERVMIEFSQPNTHKEFHVGHVRNVCLGEAISKILAYNGFTVVPVNYIGDEGTHVAKCLWQAKLHPELGRGTHGAEWYGQRYVEANSLLAEASPEQRAGYNQQISDILAELEAKCGPYFDLWLKSRKECLNDFDRIYAWLGVDFDHIFFESEVSEESQRIVDEYLQKGLFKVSEGAVGISMEEAGLGFFMARKSDGTSLYITKDLALARRKFEDFHIDRSVYVVGNEQNFHFRQLFKALELMGFPQAKACYHLSYAHVTLPEGKISSRKGNAFTFSELRRIMLQELTVPLAKYKDEWSPARLGETAHKLAAGAIKYGMLNADPQKEIVFEAEAWTSFEGHSGPYLMYSYSRTCSILDKCREAGYEASCTELELLSHPLEHELVRLIYDFNEVVRLAGESYRPSVVANHLFALCKAFNRFYAELSVLNADAAGTRSARMALVTAFNRTLSVGLGLLGIAAPEKM